MSDDTLVHMFIMQGSRYLTQIEAECVTHFIPSKLGILFRRIKHGQLRD